ncbi:4-(cytidine 5'-diphospho)-2-C-methyl-D-erythritol kinase [Youxingia wuxianensis]|uniref:4-diphosphocytidyl-2-C-methyl-D-erythritol kinase n=1 Tax=Youxingia wuxianensis TaxID=2763678 RepID=A0A926EPI9_9FIRM|nr:4-(cytidine 5'-diphospho)-2-C-methyl-D-erythritol kinase [Youxingia wuxianensis]MBC8586145.1 4-(cytidine 5'-diphospho)-2-C-methyl-D-erythritol kinase [Youxingia wuxianensis]
MKKNVVVNAPGKINLSLDITGIREDGYHNIDTIMQSIDLGDTVTISKMDSPGVFISCDRPRVPCDESNYAHIAARMFFDEFHIPSQGIAIDIQKRIPIQAGLAGGSADAAGVLVGLNTLFDVNADEQTLCQLGVKVSADVPFCIVGGTQHATGIGNQFNRLPDLPKCYLVIAKPTMGISTKDSYRRYDKYGAEHSPDIEYLIKQLHIGNLKDLASSMYNVLEEVADVEDIHIIRNKMIGTGALGSLMSGSGSAVFGIFDNRTLARKCMKKLYGVAQGVFLARPVPYGAVVIDAQEE